MRGRRKCPVACLLGGAAVGKSDPNVAPSTYKSIEDWPGYPQGFQPIPDGTIVNRVRNKDVLKHLRGVLPGRWAKVYKDGLVKKVKKSIHYFRHESGQVLYPKLKPGWSSKKRVTP